MSYSVQIVLAIAAVAYVLARRLRGEPAQGRRLLVLPAVLSLVGLAGISQSFETPVSVMFLVLGIGLGVALGALRAASVEISERGGVAFVRYTWTTAGLWIASAAIKIGESVAHALLEPGHAESGGSSMMITLGLGLLAEGLIVLHRATRAGHQLAWNRRGTAVASGAPLIGGLRAGATRGAQVLSPAPVVPAATTARGARGERHDRRRRRASRR